MNTNSVKSYKRELLCDSYRLTPDVLAEVLESHRAQLTAMALRWLGYAERAKDAVQDTFVIALMKIDQLRLAETLSSWLFAILRNVCRMYLRHSKRELLLDGDELTDHVETRQCPYDTGAEFFDRMMMRDWVWKSIEALPDALRVTVMLKYFCSFSSYEEIAAILGIPVGTVRSRLAAAKQKLSSLLRSDHQVGCSSVATMNEDYHRTLWAEVYSGKPELLATAFSSDALLLLTAQNIRQRGVRHIENVISEDLDAGVLYLPQTILCSSTVTVIEGSFINPPENPHHCPPTGVGVFLHQEETIHTMMIFLSDKAFTNRQN